jgi:hypothetical protein
LNADFTQNASIQAPVVDITASGGDVVISSKDNFTLVVKDDRIVVNGNIDLTGTLNSTSVTNVETITTSDNYINLQDGLNQEVTGVVSNQGIRIQTAPDGASSIVR